MPGQPEVTTHRDDVAFEVALRHGPFALVDDERGLAVVASVGVACRDDPGRSVGHAQVEDLALLDEGV